MRAVCEALARFPEANLAHAIGRYYPYLAMSAEQRALIGSTMSRLGLAEQGKDQALGSHYQLDSITEIGANLAKLVFKHKNGAIVEAVAPAGDLALGSGMMLCSDCRAVEDANGETLHIWSVSRSSTQ
jgi:hypothetical protein